MIEIEKNKKKFIQNILGKKREDFLFVQGLVIAKIETNPRLIKNQTKRGLEEFKTLGIVIVRIETITENRRSNLSGIRRTNYHTFGIRRNRMKFSGNPTINFNPLRKLLLFFPFKENKIICFNFSSSVRRKKRVPDNEIEFIIFNALREWRIFKFCRNKLKNKFIRKFIIPYYSPLKLKVENFLGYTFMDIFNNLSLASLILILIKLGLILFELNRIPYQISYMILINLTLTFTLLQVYDNANKYLLSNLIEKSLGWHYCRYTEDQIEDNDDRLLDDDNSSLEYIQHQCLWLMWSICRFIFKYLIGIRLILIVHNLWGRIFIILLFNLMIFNKLLLLSTLISLILNISRNLIILSDMSVGNLRNGTKSMYGNVLHYRNYEFISFWVLRGYNDNSMKEYIKTKNFRRMYTANSYSKHVFMRDKIEMHGLRFKRFFTKSTYPSTIIKAAYNNVKEDEPIKNTIIRVSPKFNDTIMKTTGINEKIKKNLLDSKQNHYADIKFSKDKKKIAMRTMLSDKNHQPLGFQIFWGKEDLR